MRREDKKRAPKSGLVEDPKSSKSQDIKHKGLTFTIFRASERPDNGIIPGMDSQYLGFFDEIRQKDVIVKPPFQWQRDNFFRYVWYGKLELDISSPLCRASVLVLASSLKHNRSNKDSCRYFAAFCENAKVAIRNGNWKDLAYASHVMTVVAWHCPLDSRPTEIMVHFLQFCRIAQTMNETVSNQLPESIVRHCDETIDMAWLITAFAYDRDGTRMSQIWDRLWEIMELSSWLTREPYGVGFRKLDSNAAGYLNSLNNQANIHLAIVLNQFILKVGERDLLRLETARNRTIGILRRIQELIIQIPDMPGLLNPVFDMGLYLYTEFLSYLNTVWTFDFLALSSPYRIPQTTASSDWLSSTIMLRFY